MTCLVFETPGEIDLRAFTLMGVSAKPNTKSPIGYFGTGLKYAMAALVRLGTQPVVWIGDDKYTFFRRPTEFRGVEFDQLSMKRERFGIGIGRITEMPFTTMYGRTWKPWMIFRELESNTRDEQGTTALVDDIGGAPGRTRIVVTNADVIEAWRAADSIFLPDGKREGSGVQVIERPSRFIYWRGMRVYELSKPSQRTYNLLEPIELTEDRTLPHEYYARSAIARWVVSDADGAQVQEVITAPEKAWEHGLEFNRYEAPSPAFRETMVRYPKGISGNAVRYYEAHDDRPVAATFDLYEAHPRPWRVKGNAVVDANDRTVFDAPYDYRGKWSVAAAAILEELGHEPEVPIERPALEPVGAEHEQ